MHTGITWCSWISATPEGFACARCGLVYPVREGIPVMLVDEALSREDWDAGARKKEARS